MDRAAATIPTAFLATCEKHGNAPALFRGDQTLTYSGLLDRVLRAAAVFRRRGVRQGDRVAIWMPNSPAWVEAALGAAFAGAALVPINTRLKPREAEYILARSGASLAVAAGDFLGTDYAGQIGDLETPELRAVIQASVEGTGGAWNQELAATSPEEASQSLDLAGTIRPDDMAEVIFTSGTTGFPKGAMLNHGQIVRAYRFYGERAGIGPEDRYLIIAPMFHSFGFKAGVITSFIHGAAIKPVAVFDAAETLATIEEDGITVMGGPPTIFTSLLDLNESARRDIGSLRSIVLGGSMISPALVRTLREDTGVDIVLSAYGLTETTALVTMARASDGVDRIATTSGQVVEGMEMRCADANGREVPRGAPGEIQARGEYIMAGYFDDPERTAESFTEDGWFRTGDIGIIDKDGYLAITDRMKDMFIVGGFNCYPAEIEAIMAGYPGLQEVAVIGVPDARLGEVAKACVVPADRSAFDEQDFLAWCRDNMANFKVPRVVDVIDALPRNAMGKIQKFRLRECD